MQSLRGRYIWEKQDVLYQEHTREVKIKQILFTIQVWYINFIPKVMANSEGFLRWIVFFLTFYSGNNIGKELSVKGYTEGK